MTELELLELLKSATEGVDANFQFWIFSSIAVLMAFYFAAGKIGGYVKWTTISLYMTSAILFLSRMFESGTRSIISCCKPKGRGIDPDRF